MTNSSNSVIRRSSRYFYSKIAGGACALVVGAFGGVHHAHSQDSGAGAPVTASAEFKEPVTIDAFISQLSGRRPDHLILESSFQLSNAVISDFFAVKVKNPHLIKNEWIKSRKGMISDLHPQLPDGIENDVAVSNIRIHRVTMTGRREDIDALRKFPSVKIDVSTDKQSRAEAQGQTSPSIAAPTAADRPLLALLPRSGSSQIGVSSAGGRHSIQYMQWNTTGFNSNQTYEHDVFIYNYDRTGTYLNGTTIGYPGCWPNVVYASTSWPSTSRPYIDTRFGTNGLCEQDELAFTIGAAQANVLQPNTQYFTYMRTPDGTSSTSRLKLSGQVGHRIPSDCYTTWCSWSDDQDKMIAFPASTSPNVPGYQSWTYAPPTPPATPAAPSNVTVSYDTATSLRVTFTDNATNETAIKVERKYGLYGVYVPVANFGALPGTQRWYWINASLFRYARYCYRLRAENANGVSAYSDEACGNTF